MKRIKVQIMVLALVPMLAVVGFAGFSVYETKVLLSHHEHMRPLTRIAEDAGNVIHELQKERGMTVGMIRSDYAAENLSKLQKQRPLTDAAKQLVLDVNHGERIARDEHSYLMMAMNPAWDYRNTGVTPLSDADGRRLVHITITTPEADVEREIIAAHLESDGQKLSKERIDVLVAIGQELRSLADGGPGSTGALQITWGLAQQVKVAKLLAYFEFAEAFRLAGADNLEPEQRDLILGVVNRLSSTETSPRGGGRQRGRGREGATVNEDAPQSGSRAQARTQTQAAVRRGLASLQNSEPF